MTFGVNPSWIRLTRLVHVTSYVYLTIRQRDLCLLWFACLSQSRFDCWSPTNARLARLFCSVIAVACQDEYLARLEEALVLSLLPRLHGFISDLWNSDSTAHWTGDRDCCSGSSLLEQS